MDYFPPSREEVREALINTPQFLWPEFSAMPLNCFDLTTALLTFPGDISGSRKVPYADCADYTFDINDADAWPRIDSLLEMERWNEQSPFWWWLLGHFDWVCSPGSVRGFSITQGFFTLYMNVGRFQNIEGVDDITQTDQLKKALYRSIASKFKKGLMTPFPFEDIFVKVINGQTWAIARSFNPCNFPTYQLISPIDAMHAITIVADLDNSWFAGETIPEGVEQKHLASLWDYLSHVTLHPAGSSDMVAGTIYRETPGQAGAIDDDFVW